MTELSENSLNDRYSLYNESLLTLVRTAVSENSQSHLNAFECLPNITTDRSGGGGLIYLLHLVWVFRGEVHLLSRSFHLISFLTPQLVVLLRL